MLAVQHINTTPDSCHLLHLLIDLPSKGENKPRTYALCWTDTWSHGASHHRINTLLNTKQPTVAASCVCDPCESCRTVAHAELSCPAGCCLMQKPPLQQCHAPGVASQIQWENVDKNNRHTRQLHKTAICFATFFYIMFICNHSTELELGRLVLQ